MRAVRVHSLIDPGHHEQAGQLAFNLTGFSQSHIWLLLQQIRCNYQNDIRTNRRLCGMLNSRFDIPKPTHVCSAKLLMSVRQGGSMAKEKMNFARIHRGSRVGALAVSREFPLFSRRASFGLGFSWLNSHRAHALHGGLSLRFGWRPGCRSGFSRVTERQSVRRGFRVYGFIHGSSFSCAAAVE